MFETHLCFWLEVAMIPFGRSSTLKHAQISWFTIHVARAWFHGVLKVLTPLQWRPFLLERLLLDHRMVCVDCSWANPRIDQKKHTIICWMLRSRTGVFFFAFFFSVGLPFGLLQNDRTRPFECSVVSHVCTRWTRLGAEGQHWQRSFVELEVPSSNGI